MRKHNIEIKYPPTEIIEHKTLYQIEIYSCKHCIEALEELLNKIKHDNSIILNILINEYGIEHILTSNDVVRLIDNKNIKFLSDESILVK